MSQKLVQIREIPQIYAQICKKNVKKNVKTMQKNYKNFQKMLNFAQICIHRLVVEPSPINDVMG